MLYIDGILPCFYADTILVVLCDGAFSLYFYRSLSLYRESKEQGEEEDERRKMEMEKWA